MARTYRALALLLTYPTLDLQRLAPEALALIDAEALVLLCDPQAADEDDVPADLVW